MPIYEYKCTKCGFRFQKVTNPNVSKYFVESLTPCPQCGELARKQFSIPNIVVK